MLNRRFGDLTLKNIFRSGVSWVSTLFNPRHLSEAKEAAGVRGGYLWHFKLAMQEAGFLFLMFVGSIVHAFIPWALDFKLLEWRINRLKQLKQKLPHDEQLKKIHFDD